MTFAAQGRNANLTGIAGLTSAADRVPYFTGVGGLAALATLTAAGRNLIDDADAAAQRTTLGLGTAATLNVGTGNNNVVQLDGSAKLPAVDGSALLNLPSKLRQLVYSQSGAVATGTGTIPYDDTIPQSSEGNEFFTVTLTPTHASSVIVLFSNLHVALSVNFLMISAALFKDSGADALAVASHYCAAATKGNMLAVWYAEVAGNTTARTYKVRAGGESASTITLNGLSSARKFGGVSASGLYALEVGP